MNIRKTKFSYFAWGLFLIVAFAAVLMSSFKTLDLLGLEADVVVLAISFIVFLVSGFLVWFVGKAIVNALKDKLEMNGSLSIMGECLVLFFVFVFSFMVRFLYITYADISLLTDTFWFDLAQKEDLSGSFGSFSTSSYLYLHLLHASIALFGAKMEAGLYLNLLLQLLILFCFYFSLRLLVGKKTAIFGGFLYLALPSVLNEMLSVTPEIFWCFIQSVSLFLIILCGKFFVKNRMNAKLMLAISCVTGILIGFGVFCDYSVIFLWISALIFWKVSRDCDEHGSVPFVLRLIIPSIGVLAGFFASSYWAAGKLNIGIGEYVVDYVKPFSQLNLNLSPVSPDFSSWYSLVYIIFAIVFVLRYIKWPKDYASFVIFYLFGITAISFLGVSSVTYQSVYNYLWLFIVVFGVISLENYENQPEEAKPAEEPLPVLDLYSAKKNEPSKDSTPLRNATKQNDVKAVAETLEFLNNKEPQEPKVVKNVNEQQIPLPVRSVSSQVQQMASHNKEEAKNQVSHVGVVNENIQNISSEKGKTDAVAPVHTNVQSNEASAKVNNMHINNGIPVSVPLSGEASKHNAIVTGSNEVTLSYSPSENNAAHSENATSASSPVVAQAPSASQNNASVPEKTDGTEPPKPVMRYGRRMDYKTAVVSSPRRNIENDKSTASATTSGASGISGATGNSSAAINNTTNANTSVAGKTNTLPTTNAEAKKETIPVPSGESKKENIPVPSSVPGKQSVAAPLDKTKTSVPLPVSSPQGVNKLHNPLPTPKKHEARDLDFDYQFANSQMHFDLVDMSGKDYFDIN